MVWGSGTYDRVPFGASGSTEAVVPGQQTQPPPIPGGTATWIYQRHPQLAYALRGYAGATGLATYPGGGVSLRPLPDIGVMEVTAWWPDGDYLLLTRIHQDGTQHPVRNASPLIVAPATRRNLCTNPSVETGLNGYVADAGAPTLTRTNVGIAPHGSYFLLATAAAAGSNGVTVPSAIEPGKDLTIAFDLWLKARPTGLTVTVNWSDIGGLPLTPTVATIAAGDINRSVADVAQADAVFARQRVTLTTPLDGVTATVKIVATGMPLGKNIMGIDGVTIERGITTGLAFDGESYGGQWLGTENLSASVLAPVLTFLDGECPTDQPVSYRVTNPDATGGTMTSELAVLLSNGVTWLTHPSFPDVPRKVVLNKPPVLAEEAQQGEFKPLGGRYKVIISVAQRYAPDGELGFYVLSWAERDDLKALFRDLEPVLLRPPANYGYGAGFWAALKTQTEDPEDRLAYHDARLLTLPFATVEAPI